MKDKKRIKKDKKITYYVSYAIFTNHRRKAPCFSFCGIRRSFFIALNLSYNESYFIIDILKVINNPQKNT